MKQIHSIFFVIVWCMAQPLYGAFAQPAENPTREDSPLGNLLENIPGAVALNNEVLGKISEEIGERASH